MLEEFYDTDTGTLRIEYEHDPGSPSPNLQEQPDDPSEVSIHKVWQPCEPPGGPEFEIDVTARLTSGQIETLEEWLYEQHEGG